MKVIAVAVWSWLSFTVAGATPPSGSDAPPAGMAAGGASAEGKKLFSSGTTPSCATCHTLQDASATGNIGPDLDALKPDTARVRNAVQRGFENMPAFGHVLNAAQIDALAQYVEQAAGTSK